MQQSMATLAPNQPIVEVFEIIGSRKKLACVCSTLKVLLPQEAETRVIKNQPVRLPS